MNATQRLHDLGQSLWLDNITRDLLDSGTLKRYIDDLSVTGLTSNPTIFDHAIMSSAAYDTAIRKKPGAGTSADALFFELALEDLGRAADLFRPIHDQTDGVDGWVSLEVSPHLAYDTASTLVAAKALFARAKRPNLLIKIPGTREGVPAIEEAIFAGVPVNVTLLFSRASTTWRRPRRSCAASSVGSPSASTPMSAPSPRCSSAVGTPPSWTRRRTRCAISSALRSPSGPTRRTVRGSARPAGSASTTPAPARNASSGRAPGPTIPARPTSSISRRSPRRSR